MTDNKQKVIWSAQHSHWPGNAIRKVNTRSSDNQYDLIMTTDAPIHAAVSAAAAAGRIHRQLWVLVLSVSGYGPGLPPPLYDDSELRDMR